MRSAQRVETRRRWRAHVEVENATSAAALAGHLEHLGCEIVERRGGAFVAELPDVETIKDALVTMSFYLSLGHVRQGDLLSIALAVASSGETS